MTNQNKKKKRFIIIFFSSLTAFILFILISLFFLFNLNNYFFPPNSAYSVLIKYKNRIEKYNEHYEVYQLNTNKIFKIDENRAYNKQVLEAIKNIDYVKNISDVTEIDYTNKKLKIIVSNKEGLSINNTYIKVLQTLKQYKNIKLYIFGIDDVSYSNNTELVLQKIHSEVLLKISYNNGFRKVDIDSGSINFKLKNRPQLYLYFYKGLWDLEQYYFSNK